MKKMILVRTDSDTASAYSYVYCNPIIKKAREKGFDIILIESEKVRKGSVVSRIKKLKCDFICLSGHGSSDCFYGQTKGEKVITCNDAQSFKGTIAFARACHCLNVLGSAAVKEGCACFIGYNAPFIVARTHEMESRPDEDLVAKPTLEASNAVPIHLLKGSTSEGAIESSHNFVNKELEKWMYSKEPYAKAILQSLLLNDLALDMKGNPKVKI